MKTITAICIVNPAPHTCSEIVHRSLKRQSKRKKKHVLNLQETFDDALRVLNTRTRLRNNIFISTFSKWSKFFSRNKRHESTSQNNTLVKEEYTKAKADPSLSSVDYSYSSVESYENSSSEQSDNDSQTDDGVTFALTQKFIGWRV